MELGGHDLERVARSDTVVVSPGIPPDAPVLRALGSRGVSWISEPEFAFHFLHGSLIAVTGTNGKTTTAALTAHLLQAAGLDVGLGGNIGSAFGPPASDLALMEPAPAWFVVELSSFQLADTMAFRPNIGVLTNLAPDHLDRYGSVGEYYADKGRLFRNATPESHWVLNADQPQVEALAGDAPGRRYYFSTAGNGSAEDAGSAGDARERRPAEVPGEAGQGAAPAAFLREGELVLAWEGSQTPLLHQSRLSLLGRHNAGNALAAALAARVAGLSSQEISDGLRSFRSLPHRLEPVGEARGLQWVNDSKATNVAATAGALASLPGPLVLLLGGKDKGEDLTPLRAAIHSGVRALVLYGEARGRMAEALAGGAELHLVEGGFDEAVETGASLARPGDLLLLSPACSSFDMFESYEARGRRFAALARGEG